MRCPFGLMAGKDYDSDPDCVKCFGNNKEHYADCEDLFKALADRNSRSNWLDGETLRLMSLLAVNIHIAEFSKAAYGQSYKTCSPAAESYLKGRYKDWQKNPISVILQLDGKGLERMAELIRTKLDGGWS